MTGSPDNSWRLKGMDEPFVAVTGGGPPPHRHDFEETFTVLEGELDATFRGTKVVVRAGETVNIPANAPHQFRNSSIKAVRLMCICSPAGQEEFFLEVGVPVPTRTAAPHWCDLPITKSG